MNVNEPMLRLYELLRDRQCWHLDQAEHSDDREHLSFASYHRSVAEGLQEALAFLAQVGLFFSGKG